MGKIWFSDITHTSAHSSWRKGSRPFMDGVLLRSAKLSVTKVFIAPLASSVHVAQLSRCKAPRFSGPIQSFSFDNG